MKLLSLDPGGTTGITTKEDNRFRSYHLTTSGYRNTHLFLYNHLTEENPDLVIYEVFQFRQGMNKAEFIGIEMIGVIELWGQINNKLVTRINPSDGKGFWGDSKIKALGLWVPNLKHGMDATRIMLTYLMKNDKEWWSDTLIKLAVLR